MCWRSCLLEGVLSSRLLVVRSPRRICSSDITVFACAIERGLVARYLCVQSSTYTREHLVGVTKHTSRNDCRVQVKVQGERSPGCLSYRFSLASSCFLSEQAYLRAISPVSHDHSLEDGNTTMDYRYVSILSDELLAELLTAHCLLSQHSASAITKAQLSALRIFAAFACGLKRWEDGLAERLWMAANLQSEAQAVRSNEAGDSSGVDKGHALLAKIADDLREEDVLLARMLEECVTIGEGR